MNRFIVCLTEKELNEFLKLEKQSNNTKLWYDFCKREDKFCFGTTNDFISVSVFRELHKLTLFVDDIYNLLTHLFLQTSDSHSIDIFRCFLNSKLSKNKKVYFWHE